MTDGDARALRIMHVFRAPVGGLFRHVLDAAREQAARGHHVGLLCDASTGGERAADALEALRPMLRLGLVRMPMPRPPSPGDLRVVVAARRLIREVAADVVHGHGSKGGLYARLPAFLDGAASPVRAYTPHGGSFHYGPGTAAHLLYMGAERQLERRTDLFLFESAFAAARFEAYAGKTGKLVRVVPNGIAEAEFEPVVHDDDARDLLYIGELRVAKGVDTLIAALALLKNRDGRRLSLLIVGAGPDEQLFKAMVAAQELNDSVTFHPPAPIRHVLAKGRLMIVPSRAESLPYVVLEAAAAAEPLVATRVGGIPEIFGPLAERLVPPDDVEGLARAMAGTLDLPDDARRSRALELREVVRGGFSLERMVDGILDGYRAAARAKSDSLESDCRV